MPWSKIHIKKKLPIGWWFHKLLCELGWLLRNKIFLGWKIYYNHLNKMCDNYNINLYGNKLDE